MSPAARLDVAWLREGPVALLLKALQQAGEEARVVGGAVRNTLLGEPVSDIDIATTALPAQVKQRAEAAGFKVVPTGIEHGTVTVVIEGQPFEVTTLREDVETYGRSAKVVFGRDWMADARRRDFTMNALSAAADGTVHDYVGGLADLAARRVRFIGDPQRRIAEDYLRILRFFRFQAAYGEGLPDPAGLHACIAARTALAQLSRERVRMEMLKLLVARHAVPALVHMAEAGLLTMVLGGVALLASVSNMAKVEHAVGESGDAVRRLGALGLFAAEDAERLWRRWRLANVEHQRLAAMIDLWWRVAPVMGERAARALLYRLGPQGYLDRVLLAWSRAPQGAADQGWHALATLPRRWNVPVFPLKAKDFMTRGVGKGPQLGAAMRAAEEAWVSADFPDDAAQLAAIAAAAAAPNTGL